MTRALILAGTVAALSLGIAGGSQGANVPRWTHWLCFPNHPNDWCYVELPTTVVSAHGSKLVNVPVSSSPLVDCFYVYPTVSTEHRPNADLVLRPEEKDVAIGQAARFSSVCRMFAPLYRQTTGLPGGDRELAYHDVLAAWRDYLTHDNFNRGVVLIGHSQGAGVLKRLIREQIEKTPSVRRLLVSAILLGGDVTVADGSKTGGTFTSVRACSSKTETGCVVAYSSWGRTPPADAGLESVDQASSHVLCVNPAAPGSRAAAPITPVFAGAYSQGLAPLTKPWVHYPWVSFPGLYTARCVQQGNRAWLLVTRIHTAGDKRPTVQEVLSPNSGLHAADVNIAMQDLVDLVRSQATAWYAHATGH